MLSPVLGKSLVLYAVKREHACRSIAGVLSADEVRQSARALARLQRPSGMIPWFPGGHCDPWNHVETAMALDVAGFHAEASPPTAGWSTPSCPTAAGRTTTCPTAASRRRSSTPTSCAYIATGVWHHWLCTWDRAFVETCGRPSSGRSMGARACARADGLVLWAVEADDTRPWDYALLTGSSSIAHALSCGARLGRRPRSPTARLGACGADDDRRRSSTRPEAFEPKDRWAMDWYYPVLTRRDGRRGRQGPARRRLVDVRDGRPGHPLRQRRAVGHRRRDRRDRASPSPRSATSTPPPICSRWTRPHRRDDGSYWTGIVYPTASGSARVPVRGATPTPRAAVILAADAITGAAPGGRRSSPPPLFD